MGIDLGKIEKLLHVVTLLNREYVHTQDGKLTLSKKWSKSELTVSLNTVVENVKIYQKDMERYRTIESVFTEGSVVFMNTTINNIPYGSQGTIQGPNSAAYNGRLKGNFEHSQSILFSPILF